MHNEDFERDGVEDNREDTAPVEESASAASPEKDNLISENGESSAQAAPECVIEVIADGTENGAKSLDGGSSGGDTVAAPPKKKKAARIFWNLFLVAVIAAGILSLFGIVKEIDPQSGASLGEVLRGASPVFFVVLLAVILCVMALDAAKFCIISKTVTGKYRIGTSIKTNFLGKYYDAVTPFSTGGQPMQIYYLNSKGISGGNATAMVLIRYFSSIICWITVGGALMIAGSVMGVLDGVSGGTVLKVTGWIGIAVNLIIPAFVAFFLVFPKLMHKLTLGVVKLGAKMRIVKDVDKTAARATKVVTDFKNSFKVMATSPLKLIILILVCFAEVSLTFAIPFFVMKTFSCDVDDMLITIMALNAFATFGVSFIPTPGNSGVVEGFGALAFSVVAGATVAWSVLVWRLSVFYVYIFIGVGITVYDIINKNKKYKNTKGKDNGNSRKETD